MAKASRKKRPAKRTTKKGATQGKREILHSKPRCTVCVGEKSITVKQAKGLLGWEEETEDVKFGPDFLLKDRRNNKIRCHFNIINRPLYKVVYQKLAQEHLRKRWYFNGEPIIVGVSGLLLNGQHTLISLVLAAQDWEANQEQWQAFWQTEPTMEKSIQYGVDESDKVVNTMDTCKPRTLADVFYRSAYFAKLKDKDRQRVARMAEHAIKLLWHRTGVKVTDVFAPYRTHAESLDFMDRHPKLLECLQHIYEEDGTDGKIATFVPPGYAAGFLYMMGCSTTDPKSYREEPGEKHLDWSNWEKACDFFVELAGGDPKMQAVTDCKKKMNNLGCWSAVDRWALLAKAWICYVRESQFAVRDLIPKYDQNEDGTRTIAECPVVGGIDWGDTAELDEDDIESTDPTPEEIEQRKPRRKALVEQQEAFKKPAGKKSRKSKRPKARRNALPVVGEKFWVANGKESWQGRIVELLGKNAKLKVENGHQGAGEIRPVKLGDLLRKQPGSKAA